MSIQRGLDVLDIRRSILDQLINSDDKATLAKLARVSSLFSDLALDKLWEDMTSFDPLLKLLPSHVRRAVEHGRLRNTVKISDFATFERHASRVRKLLVEPHLGSYLSRLSSMRWPLLPRLRIFTWTIGLNSYELLDKDFATVEELHIKQYVSATDPYYRGGVEEAMSLFSTQYPNLRSLRIDRNFGVIGYNALLKSAISLSSLSTLHLPNAADSDFLHDLSTNPTLKHLKLLGGFLSSAGGFDAKMSFTLHSLGVRTFETHTAVRFLEHIDRHQLADVDLEFSGPVAALGLLSSLGTCSALRRLSILVYHGEDDKDINSVPFQTSILMHLCSCRQLQELSISGTSCVSGIEESNISMMTHSWPLLQFIRLSGARSAFSLQHLRSFAEQCPHLQSVLIPLDASVPVGGFALEPTSRPTSDLKFLGASLVRCGRPDIVADFLKDAFPRLEILDLERNLTVPGEDDSSWEDQSEARVVQELMSRYTQLA